MNLLTKCISALALAGAASAALVQSSLEYEVESAPFSREVAPNVLPANPPPKKAYESSTTAPTTVSVHTGNEMTANLHIRAPPHEPESLPEEQHWYDQWDNAWRMIQLLPYVEASALKRYDDMDCESEAARKSLLRHTTSRAVFVLKYLHPTEQELYDLAEDRVLLGFCGIQEEGERYAEAHRSWNAGDCERAITIAKELDDLYFADDIADSGGCRNVYNDQWAEEQRRNILAIANQEQLDELSLSYRRKEFPLWLGHCWAEESPEYIGAISCLYRAAEKLEGVSLQRLDLRRYGLAMDEVQLWRKEAEQELELDQRCFLAALLNPEAEEFMVEVVDIKDGEKSMVRGRAVYERECRNNFGQMPVWFGVP